ncbi:MutS-related protein, partial [Anaerosporobacter sp.]|uniref:MutS-related protein n=1 Tax=Anaerosporobacter sp. TaxID=1872529 RepID=UPI00286F34F8
ILSKREEKRRMQMWKEQIKNAFGDVPDQEYTSEYFEGLKGYYNYRKIDKGNIDDITFNDLDLKNIYMLLNNTGSSIGEEYLYSLLRQMNYDAEELKERDRIITYFSDHEEERIRFQLAMQELGKISNISVFEYMNRMKDLKKYSIGQHYFCIASLLLSFGIIALDPRIGIVAICLTIGNNVYQYYKRKATIENYFKTLAFITRILSSVEDLDKNKDPFLQPYVSKMVEASKKFSYVRRNAMWISCGKSMNGSLIDSLLDYERMLLHTDLIKFSKMITIIKQNSEELEMIYETIGYLESMVAIASFRELLDYYCVPELVKGGKPFVDAKDIYHPLIDDPVVNSLNEKQSVLITGSNASGKSTFIKTLAINAILSQTIYTSTSRSYRGNYYQVYTSMALRDDLFNNESYYIVEIKSLKRILDAMNDETPILCFVDEVLRGTNTLERVAASAQILRSLSKGYVLCFAATHDIELTYILEKHFSNYHFQEEVVDNDVLFDYKLCSNRAQSRNAIKLLGMIGYNADIIEQATNAANDFLEKGTWEAL